MAHLIDQVNGKDNIAYAAHETPWHGLGQRMLPGMTIEQWREAAGLGFSVERTPVTFTRPNEEAQEFDGRHVLFRSDTGRPLSIVSSGYKTVQPAEVMEFFRHITDLGGFEMESAGVLAEGKRIWALAKVSDGQEVVPGDVVRPYLLLATSYDGSMATTAKFTTVRVVCQNTLSMTERADSGASVKVLHRETFNADKVRNQLGFVTTAFDRFMLDAKRLSERRLTPEEADLLTFDLVAPTLGGDRLPDVRKTKGFTRIMELFQGDALGAGNVGPSAWNWLNAVTQMTDWERGRNADTRTNSAWFGTGDALKQRALSKVLELV